MVSKYKDLFLDNGIEDLETILEMDDRHLEQLGINMGHKLKIIKRIREVRQQKGMYVPPSRQASERPKGGALKNSEEPNVHSGDVGTENNENKKESGGIGGGSLLDGTYDEEAEQRAFMEAVAAWRNNGKPAEDTADTAKA